LTKRSPKDDKARASAPSSVDRQFDTVYDELCRLAHRQRAGWRRDNSLNTKSLVHEAYLKVGGDHEAGFDNRFHFLCVASKAMRQVLVDHARRMKAAKRPDLRERVDLRESRMGSAGVVDFDDEKALLVIALNAALEEYERLFERQAQVFDCRFFLQLSVEETARAVGISPATTKRDYAHAVVWLNERLGGTN